MNKRTAPPPAKPQPVRPLWFGPYGGGDAREEAHLRSLDQSQVPQ